MTMPAPTKTASRLSQPYLDARRFPDARNQAIFGSIGDSAPDTWGRRLMQRSERRLA